MYLFLKILLVDFFWIFILMCACYFYYFLSLFRNTFMFGFLFLFFFFFKRKPEYEMRISDWSSDVCSSDLVAIGAVHLIAVAVALADLVRAIERRDMAVRRQLRRIGAKPHRPAHVGVDAARLQTLRAHPFGDQADDRFVGRAELGARRLVDPARVPRRPDARHLHHQKIGRASCRERGFTYV